MSNSDSDESEEGITNEEVVEKTGYPLSIVEESREIFNLIDLDGGGSLDAEEMMKLMDCKLEGLKLHPAIGNQDCTENTGGKYPIEWNEMLGRIFHPLIYKYKANIINTLPISIFNNYR